jgi:hypothetical protein
MAHDLTCLGLSLRTVSALLALTLVGFAGLNPAS